MNWRPDSELTEFMKHARGVLRLETEAALGCVDRKWTVLGGREGSGESHAFWIYYVNNKPNVNLSGLHILWYVWNVSGKYNGKKQRQDKLPSGVRRKVRNNDASINCSG